MRNLSELETKLRDIEDAEEQLILYDVAYVEGVEFRKTEEDLQKLNELKKLYKKRINEITSTEITVEECNRYIRLYLEAEEAVLAGQEYTIDGQTMVRADLNKIRQGRIWWENKKAQLESGYSDGIRFMQIVPHEY